MKAAIVACSALCLLSAGVIAANELWFYRWKTSVTPALPYSPPTTLASPATASLSR